MRPLERLDFSRLQFVDLLVAEVQSTVDLAQIGRATVLPLLGLEALGLLQGSLPEL